MGHLLLRADKVIPIGANCGGDVGDEQFLKSLSGNPITITGKIELYNGPTGNRNFLTCPDRQRLARKLAGRLRGAGVPQEWPAHSETSSWFLEHFSRNAEMLGRKYNFFPLIAPGRRILTARILPSLASAYKWVRQNP
jgi:hypothetical protein